MTTNSVHQYVLNMLNEQKVEETRITKVMTGGPDGDLGSNEILISKDKILAVIDGSGVIYDPKGIDRKELKKLALQRKMVMNFSTNLLSPKGFLVRIQDRNITLPDGELVVNGLEFRNSFHLDKKFSADLFVPCGGRPASININNWEKFLDEKGHPRFRFISEGANLFLTQEARLRLEENGVVIYKDSSANKGGVTSSSMEVLASLALTDDDYTKHMCVKRGKVPPFRKSYVEEILEIIRENASLEFKVIEKEKKRTGTSRVMLSDLLSEKINSVADSIYASELFKDDVIFRNIVECCCPRVLIEFVGFEKIMQRVPRAYLMAIFASRLASRYVYTCGLNANEIDFHNFINSHGKT
jgi:glutamate dehydrogenase